MDSTPQFSAVEVKQEKLDMKIEKQKGNGKSSLAKAIDLPAVDEAVSDNNTEVDMEVEVEIMRTGGAGRKEIKTKTKGSLKKGNISESGVGNDKSRLPKQKTKTKKKRQGISGRDSSAARAILGLTRGIGRALGSTGDTTKRPILRSTGDKKRRRRQGQRTLLLARVCQRRRVIQ